MLRFFGIFIFLCGIPLNSAPANEPAAPGRRLMFFEYGRGGNRFIELNAAGKIVREFKPLSIAVIFQPLSNGNLLYAYGGQPTGVIELDRAGKTVWNYVSRSPQVLGCERLSNGNTLIAEQGPCQVLEVDSQGKVIRTTPLTTAEKHFHRQVRNIHKLANGNILAAHEGDGAVREYLPGGQIVREFKSLENVVDAVRLPNGNTLIADGTHKRLFEAREDGTVAWEFSAADAPELHLTWISSVQVLKNGNYLVGNFLRGQEGKGAHAFEITREKKVVWSFADHARFKSLTTIRTLE